ncbi:unnamed protein product, partial [Closterium sp. NIES-53]
EVEEEEERRVEEEREKGGVKAMRVMWAEAEAGEARSRPADSYIHSLTHSRAHSLNNFLVLRLHVSPSRQAKRRRSPLRKLTDSEADSLYFTLDANGEGHIKAADVARLAAVHSFLWSEQQIEDMITLFSQSQVSSGFWLLSRLNSHPEQQMQDMAHAVQPITGES